MSYGHAHLLAGPRCACGSPVSAITPSGVQACARCALIEERGPAPGERVRLTIPTVYVATGEPGPGRVVEGVVVRVGQRFVQLHTTEGEDLSADLDVATVEVLAPACPPTTRRRC